MSEPRSDWLDEVLNEREQICLRACEGFPDGALEAGIVLACWNSFRYSLGMEAAIEQADEARAERMDAAAGREVSKVLSIIREHGPFAPPEDLP